MMILKNTVIGDNYVIGAGTVVSGTIPSNSIVKAGYSHGRANKIY